MADMNYWPLLGILVVVAGFALRFNPLLVVTCAGLVTGWAADLDWLSIIETFGDKFMSSRQLASYVLILPIIALLERYGLQQRAKIWVTQLKSVTSARIMGLYFVVRECSSALGLTSLGGHAQTVRPLLAPMALSAATNNYGELPKPVRDMICAYSAACENIALFFGEDIFIAFGAVLLMDAFLKSNGIDGIEPLYIGLWALPTALGALCIQLIRLAFLEDKIIKQLEHYRATHDCAEAE